MRQELRRRLSPALVISGIALFAAIGGGAALGLPGKKNIDSNDLKTNVVASKNIKPDAVTGADVDEASLTSSTMAASVSATASVTAATEPGTTAAGPFGVTVFHVTFPRSVQGCVPVVSGRFNDDVVALISGTGFPNRVEVTHFGAVKDFNLIVAC